MSSNKMYSLFAFIAGSIFTLLIFVSYTTKSEEILSFFDLKQEVKGINIEKQFDFAGEIMPNNVDTKERLDRELTINAYWQSATLMNLKMASKHFSKVESILAKNNIPSDFKFLAIAESGLRNATSSANAKGYWQFMKPAAIEMGLEITDDVDERLHLEKSTQAAASYINKLFKRFGNWTNVAGAYNVGPTSFARSMQEQSETNYYNMNINEETARYVFRIIAIKEILKNPNDFGYYLEDNHKYQDDSNCKEIKINTTITSLPDFAHENGISYRMLKYYNPWLISGKLINNSGKEYVIKIPKL